SNEKEYMGGLRKYMPITHWTFLISCLAIAGIPPFSGFFSKDEILVACYNFSPVMGAVMSGIAMMTAFYMFRLYYVIFWGKSYYETHINEGAHKPHEAPLTMTFPLIFLSIITVTCGFLPFGELVSANGIGFHTHINWAVAGTSVALALIGIAAAMLMYKKAETPFADKLAKTFPALHRAAYKRFYMDEIWQYVTHRIIFRLISKPIAWFDRHVIDGTFNFLAWSSNEAGESIRPWQSGDVRHYAIWFLSGTVALTLVLLYML
ncbi:proton-conducting transporter transmembrane domain-containing protein, partial [Prevotella conceptionensis]|uniref:proton-conducting transporter transmembrane domain-containing protein n=1 Tax=Prevotella conceptionensis TaxID=340486 RepID=UPI0005C5D585